MSVNPPDPTPYEGHDPDVANARNDLLEYIGNCAPVTYRANVLAKRSPLALKLLVVSTLYPVRDEDFSPVALATLRGEVQRDRQAKRIVDDLLAQVESGADPETITAWGDQVDNNTLPYRQTVADSHARRDVLNVDFERLARDFCDEVTDWAGFTDEHDTRGCYTCLHGTCMVGYEDVLGDDEDDGAEDVPAGDTALEAVDAPEPEPDREAIERRYAHEHGPQESTGE